MSNQSKVLGVFTLAMMCVSAIVSLRNFTIMSTFGLSAVLFYMVAAVTFLIPSAMVSAELASAWPKEGGIYIWVREAFGERAGFIGIWFAWMQSLPWFPTMLMFIAAALAYAVDPALASQAWYTFSVVLVVLWTATCVSMRGIDTAAWVSTVGAVIGTLIPGVFIIGLGLVWVVSGQPLEVDFSWHALLPGRLSLSELSFFQGVLLGFAGMELIAYQAHHVKNPQRDFSRAIFMGAAVIVLVSLLGSVSIAVVVPAKDLSLIAGVMQAFEIFFAKMHLGWMVKVIAVLTAVGALAQINTWLVGPCQGVMVAARTGYLPRLMTYENQAGMPVMVMLVQALVVSFLSSIMLFMPSFDAAFWLLSTLSIQMTLITYLMLFITVIRLRYSQPHVPRAYQIPGGMLGVWLVAGLGAMVSLLTFLVGFFPPASIVGGSLLLFRLFLIVGLLLMSLPVAVFAMADINKQNTPVVVGS